MMTLRHQSTVRAQDGPHVAPWPWLCDGLEQPGHARAHGRRDQHNV